MTKQEIKEKMAFENIYAIEQVERPEGKKTYILKGCYHCRKQFIAERRSALACSKSCSTSVSHKLSRGKDLSGQFKIADIENKIDFEKYPMRERE